MTIQYVDCTWSPLVGCVRTSLGCRECYAARLAATRLAHLPKYRGLAWMGPRGPYWNCVTRFVPDELEKTLHWRKPRRVFCCDMGDVALSTMGELAEILRVVRACQQHTFLLCTKRPELLLDKMPVSFFPSNVHLGVTAEDQTRFDERVPWLLKAKAQVRWLSLEPLLGQIGLTRAFGGYNASAIDRGNCVQCSQDGGLGGRFRRSHLETGEPQSLLSTSCSCTEETCREQYREERVSPGTSDDRQSSGARHGSQTRLEAFLWADTRRYGDQPQEWDKNRQQTGEPGADNPIREREARSVCTAHASGSQPEWPKESDVKDRGCRDTFDTGTVRSRWHFAGGTSSEVRGNVPAHLSDSSGSNAELEFGSGCGLLVSQESEHGARLSDRKIRVNFVVVGCESGPCRRPCDLQWVESIVQRCTDYSIPCFVKQLDLGGRVSRDPTEWPEWARRRQLPSARSSDV